MNSIIYRVSPNIKELKILCSSDWHLGNSSCNLKKIKEDLNNAIKNDWKIYLGGDNLDLILSGDKRYIVEETIIPTLEGQMRDYENLLKPVADRIIASVYGGHSITINKRIGINPEKYIHQELNIPVLGFSGYISIRRAHRPSVNIYVCHGAGSQITAGSMLTKLHSLGRSYIFDIAIMSHTHKPIYHIEPITFMTNRIEQKEIVYINSGGYLERPLYAETKGYPVASLRTPLLTIHYGTEKPTYLVDFI